MDVEAAKEHECPFKINNEALYPLYNMPHTQLAIEYCVKVVELWPLQIRAGDWRTTPSIWKICR